MMSSDFTKFHFKNLSSIVLFLILFGFFNFINLLINIRT